MQPGQDRRPASEKPETAKTTEKVKEEAAQSSKEDVTK